MSHPPLLPQTVRIKRKRQDEPVDTLHVHTQDDSKRRRHTTDSKQQSPAAHQAQAVFRRVHEAQDRVSETAGTGTGTAAAANAGAAGIKGQPSTLSSTGPSPSLSSSPAAASPDFSSGSSRRADGHGGGGCTGGSSRSIGRRILTPGPQATRRFHLARSSHQHSSSFGGSLTTGPAGGVKKRKNVATLVESKPKKHHSDEYLNPALTEYVSQRLEEQSGLAEPPLKRPGKSSAVSTPRKASGTLTTTSTNTPTSSEAATLQQQAAAHANTNAAAAALNAANAVDPGLLADMQRFAHEVETAEQAPSASKLNTNNAFTPGTPSRPTGSSSTPQKLKFQPKPTPRYRARHPVPAPPTAALGAMDIDSHPPAKPSSASYTSSSECESESDNDGDYVYDTYIRYDGPADVVLHDPMSSAATAATASAVPAHALPPSIGLLIIAADDQPLWEAYAEDDGEAGDEAAEREFDTDDEDSNAEDWRGNEYPEEEDEDEDNSDAEAAGVKLWKEGKRALPVEDEEWDARGLGGWDSDSDGWGENDDAAAWSDEEEARMRRPFAVPGWLRRR